MEATWRLPTRSYIILPSGKQKSIDEPTAVATYPSLPGPRPSSVNLNPELAERYRDSCDTGNYNRRNSPREFAEDIRREGFAG